MGLQDFQKKLYDGGIARKWSADPLEIPLGPMTRAKAKRFKAILNVLIQDAQVEELMCSSPKKKQRWSTSSK